jgi:hypothetical protein
MIPRMSLRLRLRLMWAIWTGQVYLDRARSGGGFWGETIRLRTVEDTTIIGDREP